MSETEKWQDENTRYLSEAIATVRQALERYAQRSVQASAGSPVIPEVVPPTFWQRLRGKAVSNAPVVRALLTPPGPKAPEKPSVAVPLSTPAAKDSENARMSPALPALSRRLGMTRFEEQMLLLCCAAELDPGVPALCAKAQDDPARTYPTFALGFSIFESPEWEALSPERSLRYWRLLEINQPGAQVLTTSALRADERIVNYVKGLNHLDDRLAPLLLPLDVVDPAAALSDSQRQQVERILVQLREPHNRVSIVHLDGDDATSKQAVASVAAAQLGLRAFRIPAGQLPAHAGELETLARLWFRESLLLPVALYVDATDVAATDAVSGQVSRFLSRTDGVIFLDAKEAAPALAGSTYSAVVEKPSHAEQKNAWEAALGGKAEGIGAALAEQFHLNLGAIRKISQQVLQDVKGEAEDLKKRAWDACVRYTKPGLENLAQSLDPRATWDDIVLPENEMSLLKQLAAQVGHRSTVYQDWGFREQMNRGFGISALFAGESGVGKTMAAEVLANDLRLHLCRIDLSAVVSKYIGETEKNLRKLFDSAEDGGAILFFDEADALFGKRSEVKDSHDRYANIEVNYLLQRMESYRGLAILATNMKSALDSAFLRRLRFIVQFAFPAPAQREVIWRKVFPAAAPVEGLDYARLAKLPLTGGSIRSIAVNSAFLAASEKAAVTMRHVLDCARKEFHKLERPINEMDFRLPAVATSAAAAGSGQGGAGSGAGAGPAAMKAIA
jgi:SpoVK/Ycf46/Vps4 family AAA+-type ATPase